MESILSQRVFANTANEAKDLREQNPELRLPSSIYNTVFGQPVIQKVPTVTSLSITPSTANVDDLTNTLRHASLRSVASQVSDRTPTSTGFGMPSPYEVTRSSGRISNSEFQLPSPVIPEARPESPTPAASVVMRTAAYDDEKIMLPPPESEKYIVLPPTEEKILLYDSGERTARWSSASGSTSTSPYASGASPGTPFIQPSISPYISGASPIAPLRQPSTAGSLRLPVSPTIHLNTFEDESYFGFVPPPTAQSGIPPVDEELGATLLRDMDMCAESPDPRITLDWAEEVLRFCRMREQYIERISKVQIIKSEPSDTERTLKTRALQVVTHLAGQPAGDSGPAAAAAGRATFIQARWVEKAPSKVMELLQQARWKGWIRSNYHIGNMFMEDKSKTQFGVEHWDMGAAAGDRACQYVSQLCLITFVLIKTRLLARCYSRAAPVGKSTLRMKLVDTLCSTKPPRLRTKTAQMYST
jgi:hypothetical protein